MGNALCPGTYWEQIVWVYCKNFIVKDVAWDCLSRCSPKHPSSAFNLSANKCYFYTALALSTFCTFSPEIQTAFIQTNLLDRQGMIGEDQYQAKNVSSPSKAIIPRTSEFPPFSSTLARRQPNMSQPSTTWVKCRTNRCHLPQSVSSAPTNGMIKPKQSCRRTQQLVKALGDSAEPRGKADVWVLE